MDYASNSKATVRNPLRSFLSLTAKRNRLSSNVSMLSITEPFSMICYVWLLGDEVWLPPYLIAVAENSWYPHLSCAFGIRQFHAKQNIRSRWSINPICLLLAMKLRQNWKINLHDHNVQLTRIIASPIRIIWDRVRADPWYPVAVFKQRSRTSIWKQTDDCSEAQVTILHTCDCNEGDADVFEELIAI